jgi:hypothetical protein
MESSQSMKPHFFFQFDITAPSTPTPSTTIKSGTINGSVIGSTYLEYGNTKLCVYIFSPRPATIRSDIDYDQGLLDCEISVAAHLQNQENVIFHGKNHPNGLSGLLSRYSTVNINALTPAVRLKVYPKCQIMISVVLLESSYLDLSAIITGSSLALMNAAVEMKDLVISSSLVGSFLSSSSSSSEQKNDFFCQLACCLQLNEITFIDFIGNYHSSNSSQSSTELLLKMKEQCHEIKQSIIKRIQDMYPRKQ